MAEPLTDPDDLSIRGLKKADYDYIVSVLDRWWGGPSGQRADPMFYYELGAGGLVAEHEGEVVGFLLGFLTPGAPPVGFIHLVGIHPDRRRRGVGLKLYERFTKRAREAGAAELKAIAAVGNDGSLRFHEALGFHTKKVDDYAGPGRARLVFRKRL
ncbi:MAG: GNAT family N-acetyltransferase [Myxococcota bacterium]